MLTRTFLPVGQGACYLERFTVFESDEDRCSVICENPFFAEDRIGRKARDPHEYNMLYDCGSTTAMDCLERSLKEHLKIGSTIDAVFISHFDEDHVNGLPFLFENYDVKNLYIPLLTQKEIDCLRLGCACGALFSGYSAFFNSFLENYENIPAFINKDVNVHYIAGPENKDDYENNEEEIRNLKGERVCSGDEITLYRISGCGDVAMWDWVYVPFNYRETSKYKKMIVELENEFGSKIDLKDALYMVDNDPSVIPRYKSVYERIPGDINSNSMVLFSGPKDKKRTLEECFFPASIDIDMFIRTRAPIGPGCLYMGDYDANGKDKWKKLKEAYSEYWSRIGCIQIPHHGSKNNYNKELANDPRKVYVISAGEHNPYGHPDDSVIKDLYIKRSSFHVVTEDKQSKVEMIMPEILCEGEHAPSKYELRDTLFLDRKRDPRH